MAHLRNGRSVVPPTPKAMRSVTEVTVMATPACPMQRPNLRTRGRPSTSWRLSKFCKWTILGQWCQTFIRSRSVTCTMTNMSSMPIPSRRKGRMSFMKVWGTPT